MGYRYYFYALPKVITKAVRACKTDEEYISICRTLGKDIDNHDEDGWWCSPAEICKKMVYNFGKTITFDPYKDKDNLPLFDCDDLAKKYQDYDPIICSQKTFLEAIQSYHTQTVKYYTDLLKDDDDTAFIKRTAEEKQKFCIEQKISDWQCQWCKPYDLDLSNDKIVRSWDYEYAIFELVHRYKMFDWENDDLIFMGY